MLKEIKLASPALHPRDFIPVLTHLCFNKSHITSFNDKTAIMVACETSLHCAVPGQVLLAVMEGCSDAVSLEQKDWEAVIKDKGTVVRIPTLTPASFVFDPGSVGKTSALCKLSAKLVEGLELAAANSNAEAVRPNLTGVTFVIGPSNATLYCTDNVTVTKTVIPLESKRKSAVTGILPRDSCELLAKTYKDMGEEVDAELLIGDKVLVGDMSNAAGMHVQVVCKLVQADPADYEKMISENSAKRKQEVECPASVFEAAKRAGILTANDPDKSMLLETAAGVITLSSKGALGEMQTKIKVKAQLPQASYTVNPDMLLRAAAWASTMELGGRALALRGAVAENGTVEYLIAPKG